MRLSYRDTRRACYLGCITQAISVNLAPLFFIIFQNDFGISFEQIGRLILINFGTQILADIFATRYVDRIGYRTSVVASMVLSVIGLWGLSILPDMLSDPYMGLMISVVIYAWGSGLIEVLISPIVDSLPGDEKAAAMSLMHSFYCWGQVAVVLITTLVLFMFGSDIWRLLPFAWSFVPLFNCFYFMRVPLSIATGDEKASSIGELLRTPFFMIAMLLMMCSGSAELTMSQWSSLFAEKGLGVTKIMGDLLGPCMFAMFMGAGRLLYGIYGGRIDLRRTLIISSALCILCYAVTIFVMNPFVSLAGCALCGLSVSLMWPGTLSLSARRFPLGGTALFGVLAICGDIGGSIGPWLAGFVSDLAQRSGTLVRWAEDAGLAPDQMGLKAGLLVTSIFPVILLIFLLSVRDKQAQ